MSQPMGQHAGQRARRHASPAATSMFRGWPAGALRLALTACLTAYLVACLAACGASTKGTGVHRNDAIMLIAAEVPDAELWVDDRFVGHVRSLRGGVALRPGSHRIELRHDRYHTHYQMLTVEPRERRTITVDLAEVLP